MHSAGLMEAYRGNQSKLPVTIRQPETAADENGAQSSAGGGGFSGGGGGDGGDPELARLSGALADAEHKLQIALKTGIGILDALKAVAHAMNNLSNHSKGGKGKGKGKITNKRPKRRHKARGHHPRRY